MIILLRIVGLSVNEIADMLEELPGVPGSRNVSMWPDVREIVTDEDSEEEEDTGGVGMDINHLGRGMLRSKGEVAYYDEDDEQPDLTVYNSAREVVDRVEDETMEQDREGDNIVEEDGVAAREEDGEEAGPSRRKNRRVENVEQLSRTKNNERGWYEEQLEQFGDKIPAFVPAPARSAVPAECHIPYDFLRLFLNTEFIDLLVVKSKLYSVRKGLPDKQASITSDSLLTSMGVLYLTGYLTPAQRPLFWEDRIDVQNMFVKNAISRNKFRDVLMCTYFTDAGDIDLGDAFWKVRPLFNHINDMARQYVEQPEWVCVDESIIRYFGPHPLKQCIREKPDR